MANVEGLNLRGSRWCVRIIIPDDLRHLYGGKARVNPSLGTSDRREATLRATIKRAEWLADFDAQRTALNPKPLEVVTPQMAALLAQQVRATVLKEDDRVRSDLPLIAEMVHKSKEWERLKANRLLIPMWDLPEPRVDDLTGLTEEEAEELADLNTYLNAKASANLARRNLAAVLPLVVAEAKRLGLAFDHTAPGGREALEACLKAYRKACHEVTLRDAGEVIETPPQVDPLPREAPKTPDTPKTLRDVFDRWAQSGSTPRSKDSVGAMGRAVRQFEEQHPAVALRDISRDMGDTYRGWLLTQCKTSKTARDRLTAIKTLMKYAANTLEWTQRHTWEGLGIKAKTAAPPQSGL